MIYFNIVIPYVGRYLRCSPALFPTDTLYTFCAPRVLLFSPKHTHTYTHTQINMNINGLQNLVFGDVTWFCLENVY